MKLTSMNACLVLVWWMTVMLPPSVHGWWWGGKPKPCTPVDCQVSPWGQWTKCDAECNVFGKKYRYRYITVYPKCGGKGCPHLVESMVCIGQKPRDCQYTEWGPWTPCDATRCTQFRTRSIKVTAACGGMPCQGPFRQNRICHDCEHGQDLGDDHECRSCDDTDCGAVLDPTQQRSYCHSSDPSMWVQCLDIGQCVENVCPPGMEWSVPESTCVYSCNTCEYNPCSGRDVLYCHSVEAALYVECSGNDCYERSCAPGTVWNVQESKCDFPLIDPSVTTPEPDPSCVTCADNPCAGGGYRTVCHLDESLYVECVSGVCYERPCPAGTVWNQLLQFCDFPDNV